jgi:hypothetical protein
VTTTFRDRPASVTTPPRGSGLRTDVTACLTAWLLLLYGINAGMVVPVLGAIGQPATLAALGAFFWWVSARTLPTLGLDRDLQPIRIALYVYVTYLLASYGSAGMRTLTEIEASNSTRAVITLFALFGIAAIACDGIHDKERLRRLLRRLTTFGAVFAALGIVQATTGESFLWVPPGLEWNAGLVETVGERGGLNRPRGTARHPIEYSVVVASLLPLAIHFAWHARSGRDRTRGLIESSLLLVAVPLSLSRTAVVCLAAALLVMGLGWTWRQRANAIALAVMGIPLVAGLVPGAYQVMIGLFRDSETDASIQARLDRVPTIMGMIQERPWFGMGYGTFNGTDHFVVDNQLWVTTISTGLVGLVLTVGLFVVGALTATAVQRRPAATVEDGYLGWAIAGGIAGMTISLATFDAFFYRILTFSLFLLLGCAGALWRLTGGPPQQEDPAVAVAGSSWGVDRPGSLGARSG